MKNPRLNIGLKWVGDEPDGLIFIAEKQIPFDIKRVYFIDQLRPHSVRGFHAHKELSQVIFAIRGKFTLELYDGKSESKHELENDGNGILINPHVWHMMKDFKDDCLIAVFASDVYKEDDYIRSFHDFKHFIKGN